MAQSPSATPKSVATSALALAGTKRSSATPSTPSSGMLMNAAGVRRPNSSGTSRASSTSTQASVVVSHAAIRREGCMSASPARRRARLAHDTAAPAFPVECRGRGGDPSAPRLRRPSGLGTHHGKTFVLHTTESSLVRRCRSSKGSVQGCSAQFLTLLHALHRVRSELESGLTQLSEKARRQ